MYQQKETTGAHPHKFKDMTTEQEIRLDNAKNQVLALVSASEHLNMDFQLQREMFFANNAAINRIINAMEDEVTNLEGTMSNVQYKVWTITIDALRKL